MGFSDWMVVNLPLEEQLSLERASRTLMMSDDVESVREIAASLIKQNAYQQQLLKQAVTHCIDIESQIEAEADSILNDENKPHGTDRKVHTFTTYVRELFRLFGR